MTNKNDNSYIYFTIPCNINHPVTVKKQIIKSSILIILISLFCLSVQSQNLNKNHFSAPVKIPIYLSGNFGELRSNHFHTGIDIKTQGKTGFPVYAVDKGYVSRINISPSGYGLALYINHPNGKSSVYGHLSKLSPELTRYAKKNQYEQKSFQVNLFPSKDKFPVKKGEIIAYTGNSGSSGGPHIHFEIRDTKTEHPLNPLFYIPGIKDDIAPKIQSIAIYPLSYDSNVSGKITPKQLTTVFYNNTYHLKGNAVIQSYGEIGIGIKAIDYLNGSWNKCGIYETKLFDDDTLIYDFCVNELSFDKGRYINSHIDYAWYIRHYVRIQKSWKEPGNMLGNYKQLKNNGKISLRDGKIHHIRYEIKDAYGNTSRLNFCIQSHKIPVIHPTTQGIKIAWDQPFLLKEKDLTADFKKGTFYTDVNINCQEKENMSSKYASVYELGSKYIPVQNYYQLSIKPKTLPKRLQSKAIIVSVNPSSGRHQSLGGNYSDGLVKTSAREFGSFTVDIDTIPPTIIPLNIRNKKTLINHLRVSFKISDKLSGIKNYTGIIDGKWVLFEYNLKKQRITYTFDPERMTFGKNHQINLTVSDNKNNVATYEASFYK